MISCINFSAILGFTALTNSCILNMYKKYGQSVGSEVNANSCRFLFLSLFCQYWYCNEVEGYHIDTSANESPLADGILEKDRRLMTSVLNSVSQVKENIHHLSRHLWAEVREDWPFYTDMEKEVVRR